MRVVKGFFMAWGNFCIIPCPYRIWDDSCRKHMLGMLPVLGLLLGTIWYGIARLLLWLPVPQMLAAAALTVYPFYISGFMHLDGYMDCSDAIFSRASLQKKKEILKDSRVGAFAVIWLVVLFLMVFAGMQSWMASGMSHMEFVIILPVLSRTTGALCILKGRHLDVSQYNNLDEGILKQTVFVISFAIISIAAAVLLTDMALLVPSLLSLAAGSLFAIRAAKNLGGVNGDIAGYSITWAECFAIIGAAIFF